MSEHMPFIRLQLVCRSAVNAVAIYCAFDFAKVMAQLLLKA
jgi:hypothetical protein